PRPAVVIIAADAEHSLKNPIPARSGTNGSIAISPTARWTRNRKKTVVMGATRASRQHGLDGGALDGVGPEWIRHAVGPRATARGQVRLDLRGHALEQTRHGSRARAAVRAEAVDGHEPRRLGEVLQVARPRLAPLDRAQH